MEKHELQNRNKQSDEVPPTAPRDPIEPDPMNPAEQPSADAEPERRERPDLDWAEHED